MKIFLGVTLAIIFGSSLNALTLKNKYKKQVKFSIMLSTGNKSPDTIFKWVDPGQSLTMDHLSDYPADFVAVTVNCLDAVDPHFPCLRKQAIRSNIVVTYEGPGTCIAQ